MVANEALGLLRVQCGLRRLIGTPVVLKHETEPAKLAALAQGRLRKKKEPIVAALQGCRWPETHRFLLQEGMEHLAVLVGCSVFVRFTVIRSVGFKAVDVATWTVSPGRTGRILRTGLVGP